MVLWYTGGELRSIGSRTSLKHVPSAGMNIDSTSTNEIFSCPFGWVEAESAVQSAFLCTIWVLGTAKLQKKLLSFKTFRMGWVDDGLYLLSCTSSRLPMFQLKLLTADALVSWERYSTWYICVSCWKLEFLLVTCYTSVRQQIRENLLIQRCYLLPWKPRCWLKGVQNVKRFAWLSVESIVCFISVGFSICKMDQTQIIYTFSNKHVRNRKYKTYSFRLG